MMCIDVHNWEAILFRMARKKPRRVSRTRSDGLRMKIFERYTLQRSVALRIIRGTVCSL